MIQRGSGWQRFGRNWRRRNRGCDPFPKLLIVAGRQRFRIFIGRFGAPSRKAFGI
jgi:hypothetical protein